MGVQNGFLWGELCKRSVRVFYFSFDFFSASFLWCQSVSDAIFCSIAPNSLWFGKKNAFTVISPFAIRRTQSKAIFAAGMYNAAYRTMKLSRKSGKREEENNFICSRSLLGWGSEVVVWGWRASEWTQALFGRANKVQFPIHVAGCLRIPSKWWGHCRIKMEHSAFHSRGISTEMGVAARSLFWWAVVYRRAKTEAFEILRRRNFANEIFTKKRQAIQFIS